MEILDHKAAEELIKMHQQKANGFQLIYDTEQLWSVEMFVILPDRAINIYIDVARPEMRKAFKTLCDTLINEHVKARIALENYIASGKEDIINL